MILLCSLTLVLALAPSPPSIELSGEQCAGPTLEARVANYLSGSEADAEQWSARGVLTQLEGTWSIDLEIALGAEPASLRQFSAGDCETVLDAAAFVFAVAVDPAVAAREVAPPPEPLEEESLEPVEPEPEQEAGTEPEPDAEPPLPSPPSPALRSSRLPRQLPGTLGVDVGVMGGALPGAQALFVLSGGVTGKAWRSDLLLRVRLPSRKSARLNSSVGGQMGMWSVGAQACYLPRVGTRIEFPLCAGVEGGQLFAEGVGFPRATTTRVPWGAATFAPGLAITLGERWAIIVHGELGAAFNRAEFVVEQLEVLHSVGALFGRGLAGLELRF